MQRKGVGEEGIHVAVESQQKMDLGEKKVTVDTIWFTHWLIENTVILWKGETEEKRDGRRIKLWEVKGRFSRGVEAVNPNNSLTLTVIRIDRRKHKGKKMKGTKETAKEGLRHTGACFDASLTSHQVDQLTITCGITARVHTLCTRIKHKIKTIVKKVQHIMKWNEWKNRKNLNNSLRQHIMLHCTLCWSFLELEDKVVMKNCCHSSSVLQWWRIETVSNYTFHRSSPQVMTLDRRRVTSSK